MDKDIATSAKGPLHDSLKILASTCRGPQAQLFHGHTASTVKAAIQPGVGGLPTYFLKQYVSPFLDIITIVETTGQAVAAFRRHNR